MLENPKCGLFLDMGLGKTVVSLTGINILSYAELEVRRTLIIAPKRVVQYVWRQEAQQWAHTRHLRFSTVLGTVKQRMAALAADADVYLINRENVSWLCAQYGGNMLPFDMVIIDESSSFKNHTSKRFRNLRIAIQSVPRVVLLTGTPAPKGYINLWSQIYLLDQGERLGRTITAFRERYFTPGHSNNGIVYQYHLRPGAADEIQRLIGDICISFKSEDWLDLPEVYRVEDFVDLEPEVQEMYNDFEREQVLEFIDSGEEVTAVTAASLCNKLLQFANGAIYYNDRKDYNEIHAEKIERLKDIIEDANGKSVLVGYCFIHDRDRLMRELKQYNPRLLKTDKDKQDWDRGDIHVLLGHPASLGHGLNMQSGGSIAVWFGCPWDLELYQQFNKRLHRQGQTQPVFIHHLIARETEDQRVIKTLRARGSVQDGLMESLKAKIARWSL